MKPNLIDIKIVSDYVNKNKSIPIVDKINNNKNILFFNFLLIIFFIVCLVILLFRYFEKIKNKKNIS
jgi:hypothetical protein